MGYVCACPTHHTWKQNGCKCLPPVSQLLFSSTLSASKTAGTTVLASWESSSLHSSAVLGVLNGGGIVKAGSGWESDCIY